MISYKNLFESCNFQKSFQPCAWAHMSNSRVCKRQCIVFIRLLSKWYARTSSANIRTNSNYRAAAIFQTLLR